MSFKSGDNVLLKATIQSVDARRRTARVLIGWGPNRSIITVPFALLERPLPEALKEAATWVNDLYGEKPQ